MIQHWKATLCLWLIFLPRNKNLVGLTYSYGHTHRNAGLAFRAMHNYYYFLIGMCLGDSREKKATATAEVVHSAASSVLSHLPAVAPGVHCAHCHHCFCLPRWAHPQWLLPLPPWPGRPERTCPSIFNTLPQGQRRVVTPRAGLRLGATSQDDHLSTSHLCLELHWISLSQTSSLVSRSPGLLCLSLLITDDKVVDETRGLVTFIPGYMRCVQFLKMYLTCERTKISPGIFKDLIIYSMIHELGNIWAFISRKWVGQGSY